MTKNPKSERKTALVTGSSKGIGKACAIKLARNGNKVVINYLNDESGARKVAEEVNKYTEALVVRADVGSYPQVKEMFKQANRKFGGVQILVNNAGFSHHATLEDLEPEDWKRMMEVNLDGAYYCSKQAAPYMTEAGWGRIVNIVSLRAMTGSDHGSHYASSKAGIIGLTKSLALELAPNVTVNGISPGYTRTSMTRESLEKKGDEIRAKIPLNRAAEPEEIAAVVGFLASEDASYMTGETLNVNGGIYMR